MTDHQPISSEIIDVEIPKQEAFAANQASWDERAAVHGEPEF